MLRNEMWQIFKATGDINAYLYYKEVDKNKVNEKDNIKCNNIQEKDKVIQGL